MRVVWLKQPRSRKNATSCKSKSRNTRCPWKSTKYVVAPIYVHDRPTHIIAQTALDDANKDLDEREALVDELRAQIVELNTKVKNMAASLQASQLHSPPKV